MANSIAKVTQYLADPANLNAVYKASALTQDLEANEVKFIGANIVKLPKFSFGGALGTYNRATGHVANDITKAWDTYTLSQDKGNKILLDKMDDEESGAEGIIKAFNEYLRQVVVPAVDTYRFSTLVSNAGTTVEETSTAANIIDQLEAGFKSFEENEVPVEGSIIYMTPATKSFLQLSSDLSRYVSYGTFNGQIDNRVMYFNGAKIVTVPSSRLGTDIQFILVQPKSVLSCVKHNPSKFWAEIPGLDASQIDFRLYYDLFVIANKNKGVYVQDATA
jgi:hypothetical protein